MFVGFWDGYILELSTSNSNEKKLTLVKNDPESHQTIGDMCKTSDGSYVMTGKALESDGGSVKKAFAVKLTSTGTVSWVWGSMLGTAWA